MERITSRQNPHFKLARKLAESARERNNIKQILMDGTRLIRAYADQFGLKDSTLLISEAGADRAEIRHLFESTSPGKSYLLGAGVLREIREGEGPEGIGAMAGIPCSRSRTRGR